MRRFKVLSILVLVVAGLMFTVSCDGNTTSSSTKNNSNSSSVVVTNEYTLNFNTNGGSSITSLKLEKGRAVVKPADPTKAGLTFSGWYSDIDLLEAYTFPGVMPEKNLTLYAKYSVMVTFDTNGGEAIDPIVADAKAIVTYPTPKNGDNIFVGWYLDSEMTTKATILIPEMNSTLYAKWQVLETGTAVDVTNDVMLSGWDGDTVCYNIETLTTGVKVSSTVDKGSWSAVKAPITVNVKENTTIAITFMGTKDVQVLFKLEKSGSEDIVTKESEFQVMTGEETTYIWTVDAANLTETGQQNLIIFLNPGNEGVSEGTTPDYVTFKSIKFYKTIGMDDAKEEAIYFNTLGGSSVMPIKEVLGTTVTMPADPTKAGFDFDGWYTSMNYDTMFTFDTMPTGPTTVYAKWTENEDVLLNVNTNGGILLDNDGNEITSLLVASGSTFNLGNPSKMGYLFDGYYKEATFDTMFTETSIVEETTIYAKWINTGVELNPSTAMNVLSTDFMNFTPDIYTITQSPMSLVLTSSTKGDWDLVYTMLDTTMDYTNYTVLHVVLEGPKGQAVLFKINDADEYRVTLNDGVNEMYFMLKNAIDTSKKQIIFAGAGTSWTTETTVTVSKFEFLKEEMNDTLTSYSLMDSFASHDSGRYTFTHDSDDLVVAANITKTAWNFAEATLPTVEAPSMKVFHAAFSGTAGTQVLFKFNNSFEKWVTIEEDGTAEVYWILPAAADASIDFIFFIDGPIDYTVDRTEANIVTFSVIEMLLM